MEKMKELDENKYAFVLGAAFLIGFIGHLIPLTYKIVLSATPYVVIVSFGLVYINLISKQKEKLTSWMIGVVIITFIAEIIGTKTGLLFGRHSYTDILGFRLIGVPVIIGLNWAIILLGVILIANKFIKNIYLAAIAIGVIIVIFDLILEPVATKLYYWSWVNNTIPLKNYITWFLMSVIASFVYNKLEIKTNAKLPIYYMAIQAVFFVLLLIFFR
ncbi:MAG: carotenoid biosynthesis protein [bacterium]